MLPDSLKGRASHTTTIVHRDPTHKRLFNFGGLYTEGFPDYNDIDMFPAADTTIVELGECTVVQQDASLFRHNL